MIADQFEAYRPLLFALAYRMMGTATEAEDIVQDTYLQVQAIAESDIRQPKSYLTTVVTRLCLNKLKAASTQREQYLGPWLPEPVFTDNQPQLVSPVERVIAHESISIAFLILLESLTAAERAVFILHEVFDYKFREIGEMLNKSDAACRQLFRRAKQHITQHRVRFQSTPDEHERLLRGFIEVVGDGDFNAFLEMLTEDVTLVPDGGGERGAATQLLTGRDSVVAFIQGVQRIAPPRLLYEVTAMNGQPAILARTEQGRPYFALFLHMEAGRVRLIHVIAGRKLKGLEAGG